MGAIEQFQNYCHQADRLKDQPLVKTGWDNSYSLTQKNTGVRMMMDQRQITLAHLADLWINGFYFHGSIDDPKTRELESLSPFLGFERFEFVRYVGETLRQVLYVDSILRHALRDGCVRD